MKIKPAFYGFLLALAVFGIYIGVARPLELLERFDYALQDSLARHRYRTQPKPPGVEDIVLVAFDENAYYHSGERWPWSRARVGDVVKRIAEGKPRFIIMDFVYVGKTEPEDDEALAQAFKEAGNVLIADYFGPRGEWVRPEKIFRDASLGQGSISRLRTSDFVMRRIVGAKRVFGEADPTLDIGIQALARAEGLTVQYTPQQLTLGDPRKGGYVVPLDHNGGVPLRYTVEEHDVRVIPVLDLLSGKASPDVFRDKIVLVGTTGYIYHDRHPSPLGVTAGVMQIANTYLMLRNRVIPRELPLLPQWVLIFLATWLAAWGSYRFPIWQTVIGIGASLFLFGWLTVQLDLRNVQWDLATIPLVVVVVFLLASLHRYISLAYEMMRLRVEATTDGLTGVNNVRYMQVRMAHELARVQRYGGFFSVVLFDVDNFKRINDSYGHNKGNEVLLKITDVLKRRARKADLVGRLGGDEFCAVLFNTGEEGSRIFSEQFLEEIRRASFFSGSNRFTISLSIGVATIRREDEIDWEKCLARADVAAYESKRTGKNRVSIYKPQPLPEGTPSAPESV